MNVPKFVGCLVKKCDARPGVAKTADDRGSRVAKKKKEKRVLRVICFKIKRKVGIVGERK